MQFHKPLPSFRWGLCILWSYCSRFPWELQVEFGGMDNRPSPWKGGGLRAAFGRLPHPSGLTASHLPPGRGKAFGRVLDPPLRRIWEWPRCSRRGRSQTGPTGFVPGALARESQAHKRDRTGRNFCKPRAQWPGRNRKPPLRFCAPEVFRPAQGITPVMGVLGDGRHGGGRLCRTADCARPLALFW